MRKPIERPSAGIMSHQDCWGKYGLQISKNVTADCTDEELLVWQIHKELIRLGFPPVPYFHSDYGALMDCLGFELNREKVQEAIKEKIKFIDEGCPDGFVGLFPNAKPNEQYDSELRNSAQDAKLLYEELLPFYEKETEGVTIKKAMFNNKE